MMTLPRTSSIRPAKAFTLVELLLAIFLLTIGLIGLLSVFPIGADWTRQITEESIAQSVSRNAVSVIQSHYTADDMKAINSDTTMNPMQLRALPNLPTKVPVSERAYQYGSPQPFPAQNPLGAAYFWTALARLSPDQPSDGRRYEVFILVMKKGNVGDRYDIATKSNAMVNTSPMTELASARDPVNEYFVPMAVMDKFYRSDVNANGEFVDLTAAPGSRRNTPQADDLAIGVRSGTVFRSRIVPTAYSGTAAAGSKDLTAMPTVSGLVAGQPIGSSAFPAGTKISVVDATNKKVTLSAGALVAGPTTLVVGTIWTRPQIGQASTQPVDPSDRSKDVNAEDIIWVPPSNPVGRPATDTTPSPLIYVYQTTIAF